MSYNHQINSYIKDISIEFFVFMLISILSIIVLLRSPKNGWLDNKSSKIIIVLILIFFLLISVFYIIDLINISKDVKESNFVTQQITYNAKPDYSSGVSDLFAKNFVYCTNEYGEEIRLWVNSNFDFSDSDFCGVIVYGANSKCVVAVGIQ